MNKQLKIIALGLRVAVVYLGRELCVAGVVALAFAAAVGAVFLVVAAAAWTWTHMIDRFTDVHWIATYGPWGMVMLAVLGVATAGDAVYHAGKKELQYRESVREFNLKNPQ
jgi:LPS O-antigen subunit length determinant protein (WzzB/FepE family)